MSPRFEWPQLCAPEILIAGRFPFSPASVAREYRHMTFALHLHHYRGRFTLGRRVFELHPGDLTITPPLVVSRYKLACAGHHWCLHFRAAEIPSDGTRLSLPWHIPAQGGRVTEQMREIVEVWSAKDKGLAAATAGAMFQSLLLQLAFSHSKKATRRKASRSERQLDAARDHIEHHFNEPLTIEDIAKSSGLSRNYFSARFHERFGRTAQEYLLHRRMEAARMLLLSTDLPVKEVAFECGVPDPHHFNKQFRQAEGLSPSAYRARQSRS